MVCALTVRTLKPGTFDEFREAFLSGMDPDGGYEEQMERIKPFVASVGASGLYDVVEEYAAA